MTWGVCSVDRRVPMCLRRGGRKQRKGTGDRWWEERLLEGEGGGGDGEEAGEGMRWGEEGLEFLTVSKLEIRGSPSSQSFQMVQETKKLVPPGNLNAFVTCFCGGNYPWFITLVSMKIPISPAKDTK